MQRLLAALSLAAAMCAVAAAPVFATVHPLVRSECSAAAADGTPADTQDPPGITPGGPDRSEQLATPVGVAAAAAFKAEGCPAP